MTEQRKGKTKYFQNYFEKHKSNMKILWSGIKSVINTNTKTQFSNISHLLEKGTQVNDPGEMANIFNNYFVNIGSAIDKTIPRTRKSPIDYLKNRISHSIFLASVTPEEIEVIIQSLKLSKKIPGPLQHPCIPVKTSK